MNDEQTKMPDFVIPSNILGAGSIHIRFLSGFIKDGFQLRNIGEALLYGTGAGLLWYWCTVFFGIPPIVAGAAFIAVDFIPAIIILKGIYGGQSVMYMASLYFQNRKNSDEVYRLRLPGVEK